MPILTNKHYLLGSYFLLRSYTFSVSLPSMASSLTHIVVFLLISLFTTASARESQFFSKVTKETSSSQKVPSSTEQQQKRTTTLTNNEQQQIKQEEPTFVPQTTGDSYGLYGHEPGQFAPGAETTTTNSNNGTPYRTTVDSEEKSVFESESLYGNISNMNYDSNNDNGESLYSNNNNNYEQQENTYEQYNNNNENSNKYTYSKDSYVTDEEGAHSVGTTNTAAVSNQEGMSDTRFVEGGKYFYDVNNEQKYYPAYRYENWRTRSTNDEGYNNNLNGNGGYTANNYRNSNSEYNNGNSMDRGAYGQNQEEFQEIQEELEP